MFGDLMNQMQEQQQVVQEKLKELRVDVASVDHIVRMTFNGQHDMLDLKIDWDKAEDNDMVEDLLIATFNAANLKITEQAGEITKSSLSGMLPPGLSNMF